MFDNIFAAIEKWMRELLSGMVESNLSTMFTAVNQQTSEIAAQVGQTPQGWNSSIFSMIRNISDSVVIPIAGIIITLILCYELISMLTERNNLHDVDTWMFFKYFVKMWIAVYLVSHTFDIAMAVFDIGQSVVNSSSGIIRGNTAIDISSLSMQMQAAMATMAIGELVTLALETLVVSWCLKILSVVITVIMYGRMIEIYLYTSLAPIPFATMSNREWGHVGTNYFRGLFALAFQAFLMMVCVAIYAALITRKLAKLILTLLTLPLLVVVWLLKWFVTFLHCCSAWIFYLLGSVLLATAVLSFLMKQSQGIEALQMLIGGFVIFMIPQVVGSVVVFLELAAATIRQVWYI